MEDLKECVYFFILGLALSVVGLYIGYHLPDLLIK